MPIMNFTKTQNRYIGSIFALVVWIILFVTLNVPEIQRQKHYIHTICYINQSTIQNETHQYRKCLGCRYEPTLYYKLILFIDYNTTDYRLIQTDYVFDFHRDLSKAMSFQNNKYQINHDYKCYYNSQNHKQIRWSITQTIGFWIASSIFAMIFFCACVRVLRRKLF